MKSRDVLVLIAAVICIAELGLITFGGTAAIWLLHLLLKTPMRSLLDITPDHIAPRSIWNIALGAIVGAIISLLLKAWTENLRQPRISIRLAPRSDREYFNRPANRARFLGLFLANEKRPFGAFWVRRDAAVGCRGSITFINEDEGSEIEPPMPIRWAASPEPAPPRVILNGMEGVIIDPMRITQSSSKNVYPGRPERFDVAARFDDEPEAYGWCDLSYYAEPAWRRGEWKLEQRDYLIKVSIVSHTDFSEAVFRLRNSYDPDDFVIEVAGNERERS